MTTSDQTATGHWEAYDDERIERAVRDALAANRNFDDGGVLGLPGSHLDSRVFPRTEFVAGSSFLTTFIANPNHIGCHTGDVSEPFFAGTQALERDALRICAEAVLGAQPGQWDGYVASGGTEANLQALWIGRNALRHNLGSTNARIGVLHSADTHYSVAKACDVLGLHPLLVAVNDDDRQMNADAICQAIELTQRSDVRALIVVLNMGTTMFGSVDRKTPVLELVGASGLPFIVHIDAAFGGFVYPFTTPQQTLNFRDPRVVTITLDAHKMLQAPYGTGIHLCRRGMLEYVRTTAASYVPGGDVTLCGSRSGANAVAVWMILRAWGSDGGAAFCADLMVRTDAFCVALHGRGIRFFREPGMNVIAIAANHVPSTVVDAFGLVADRHGRAVEGEGPSWYKVVVMDHVRAESLLALVASLVVVAQ